MQNTITSRHFSEGTRVRWRREIAKTDWVGVVTGYPRPRMVQVDGYGRGISVGLLERVGENMDGNTAALEARYERGTSMYEELLEENAGLAEVIAYQTQVICDLQAKHAELMAHLSHSNYPEVRAIMDRIFGRA